MSDKQHREDTMYLQWQDGMYVMISDLECDYEKALIEDSLRNSVYFRCDVAFTQVFEEYKLGIFNNHAGIWNNVKGVRLTRAQALYIATGDVII